MNTPLVSTALLTTLLLTGACATDDSLGVCGAPVLVDAEHSHHDSSMHGDHSAAVLGLADLEDATDVAAASGDWSDPCSWEAGVLPEDGAQVLIPAGIILTIDGIIAEDIQTVAIHGTLQFAEDTDTELRVDTIVSAMGGRLQIGTEQAPIAAGASARIVFTSDGPLDTATDPGQLGRGAILMGPTEIHGQAVTHRAVLAEQPIAGERTLTLDVTPSGWAVGDEIVIASTDADDPEGDERRSIAAIQGATVTLDQPLERDHVAPVPGLEVHVAHLTRNVELISEGEAIEEWGHLMFMHTLDVRMHNARLVRMGRTDKRAQIDDWFFPDLLADTAEAGDGTNVRGRYAVHFHRGGVSPDSTPALVEGCVVEDNPGWGYVNHSSNVNFVNNVSYNVVGGAFQTEAGDEIGSFVGNIALRTVNPDYPLLDPETAPVDIREDSQDFAFQGDGFWIHGGGVRLEGNIAAGSSGHGFIFWTEGLREVGTPFDDQNHFLVDNIPNGELLPGLDKIDPWWVPIAGFSDNTTYSSSKGLAAYYVHATLFEDVGELTPAYLETVHSTFEDLTIWGVSVSGMHLENCERFTFRDVRLIGSGDPDTIAIQTKSTVGDRSIWERVSAEGFGVGMVVPTQGDITIRGGTWSNQVDFVIAPPEIEPARPSDARDLLIEVDFSASTHFDAEEVVHFELVAEQVLDGRWGEANEEEMHRLFLIPDRITVNTDTLGLRRLYYAEQHPDTVPVPGDRVPSVATGSYLDDVVGRTNAALQASLGMSFAGALLPNDAAAVSGVVGGYAAAADSTSMRYPACHFIDQPDPEADFFDDFDFYGCWDQDGGHGGQVPTFDHSQ